MLVYLSSLHMERKEIARLRSPRVVMGFHTVHGAGLLKVVSDVWMGQENKQQIQDSPPPHSGEEDGDSIAFFADFVFYLPLGSFGSVFSCFYSSSFHEFAPHSLFFSYSSSEGCHLEGRA